MRYLTNLRSFDFSTDSVYYTRGSILWQLVLAPLRYLHLSIIDVHLLRGLMSTELLSNTLEQLHVRVGSVFVNTNSQFGSLKQMKHLHTFTFAQDYLFPGRVSLTTIEELVDINVMPVLRRLNLAIYIRVADLNRIGQFLRFNDKRRVMVNYAVKTPRHRSYLKSTNLLPRGSLYHPREVVGVTYAVTHTKTERPFFIPEVSAVSKVFFFRVIRIVCWLRLILAHRN